MKHDPRNPPSDPHDAYWQVQVAEARRDDPGAGRGLLSTIIGFLERGQPLPPSLSEYLVEILRAGLAAPQDEVAAALHIKRSASAKAQDAGEGQAGQGSLDDFEML